MPLLISTAKIRTNTLDVLPLMGKGSIVLENIINGK